MRPPNRFSAWGPLRNRAIELLTMMDKKKKKRQMEEGEDNEYPWEEALDNRLHFPN